MRNFKIVLLALLGTMLLMLIKPEPSVSSSEPLRDDSAANSIETPKKTKKPVESVSEPLKYNYSKWRVYCKQVAEKAGIALPEAAYTLIARESHCNPKAQNPYSTAYGIGQFLDSTWKLVGCEKTSNPVKQLKCMNKYVEVIYGSWQNALSHSTQKGWY